MNIPLNIDWQQILLHLLNFVILAGGLYFLLYKPVKNFMNKRTSYYEAMDAEAKAKVTSAQKLEEEYKTRLTNAEEEIREKKASAVKEAERQQMPSLQKRKPKETRSYRMHKPLQNKKKIKYCRMPMQKLKRWYPPQLTRFSSLQKKIPSTTS